jgi:Methyltransferase FkbM domain
MLGRIPSAQIFALDFSVDKFGPQLPASYSARAHFHKVGLGAKDEYDESPQFFTLSSLMAQNNHSYIDILKIDIEGSEYGGLDAFMDSCDAASIMPIKQVMIERTPLG